MILLGLKLLFILARDCPYEQLERYGSEPCKSEGVGMPNYINE